jgi:hypothetical protein
MLLDQYGNQLQSTQLSNQFEPVLLTEAIGSSVSDGLDSDAYKYRSTSGSPSNLERFKQDRMIATALALYTFNPLAHRIIEMTKDYIIGEGIDFVANDPEVKKVLDKFWNDPVNNWGERQHQFFAEIGIYGELILPIAVNEVDGQVELGYINPSRVNEVITDPDNCLIQRKINIKGNKGSKSKTLNLVNIDIDTESETYGKLIGECFFFKVNTVSDATRGISDLFPIADWLDEYDQFLFHRLDRIALINAFVWDVTLEGLDEPAIDEYRKKNLGTPKPGSNRFHNEKVTWAASAPTLQAVDASADAKLFKNHILASAGFPDYFFAGSDSGEAVSEMNEPTLKKISARQLYVKHIITRMFNFVIDQAIIHKRLKENVDRTFAVVMPDISQKDNNRNARALAHLSGLTKQIAGFIKTVNENVDLVGEGNAKLIVAEYESVMYNIAKAINILLRQLGVSVNTKEKSNAPTEKNAGKPNLRSISTKKATEM